MLCEDKIIALYCITDDLLKAMRHREDCRVQVTDSEIITTAFVSALYFHGHQLNACIFMKMKHLVPRMLDKSQFTRRLHRLAPLLLELFFQIGQQLKDMAGAADYLLDSFPVPACDLARTHRERRLKNKGFLGRGNATGRWFYGVRVQVLTLGGVPVEFCFTPGAQGDAHALTKLPLAVASGSRIWADAVYTDYRIEDLMKSAEGIELMTARKSNSRRADLPWVAYLKTQIRKRIETHFSCIKALMPRAIYAVTADGFCIKAALFVIAYTFNHIAP